jgi:N-acetylmuramoyl-L-alanine amidase
MIPLSAVLCAAAISAPAAPLAVTVVTPRGEHRFPVRHLPGLGPLVVARPLVTALAGTATSDGVWMEVTIDRVRYRLLLDAPFALAGRELLPLAVPAAARRDTLFLPVQFLSDVLPRHAGNRFRYEAATGRLYDAGGAAGSTADGPGTTAVPNAWGLVRRHRVTIDPGHGGVDPGNPGRFFPRGVQEKHVTLQLGLLVRDELERRGIAVTMTRTRDTLIDLRDRGRFCTADCDLFVSIHVNSLEPAPGYTTVRGFETYILSEARTEDAARVARMENDAMRFEQPSLERERLSALDFILKDLQLNEHLRESARAAELVQQQLSRVHHGPNRGVKAGPFVVLNTARRPAILVEVGYSTNREDARLMTSQAGQRQLARAIADAVTRYLAEFERRTDPEASPGTTGRG